MYFVAQLANLTREAMCKIGETLHISQTLDLHPNLDRAGPCLKTPHPRLTQTNLQCYFAATPTSLNDPGKLKNLYMA